MKNYLQIFLDSLFRVTGEPERMRQFIARFYQLFIGQSPRIAGHFADTDMSQQVDMLAQSLHVMVEFSTTRVASERLIEVAIRHSRAERDIAPDLYDAWLESLLASIREFDDQFNDEVELAWRVVLSPGIAYMKFRYDRF
jgi:hemoglobin-like flavoprotein